MSMMAELTKLCPTSDVPKGSVKAVGVGGTVVAVYNVDGEFFATDNKCTHGQANLSDGLLEDDVIECALHGGAFNVRTGEVVYRPCVVPIRTYKVVVDDGQIYADLGDDPGA